MLLFSITGQALAEFSSGELIGVVYVTGVSGNEVATDLGAGSLWTSPGAVTSRTYNTNNFSLSSFTGYGYTDLNVVYFMKTANNSFWSSGDANGQTNTSGKQSVTGTGIQNVQTYYDSLTGGSQVTGVSTYLNSYWKKLDQSRAGVGRFLAFLPGTENGDVNLAALATTGYVDQYIYYYPRRTNDVAGSGVKLPRSAHLPTATPMSLPFRCPRQYGFWVPA